MTTVPDLLRTKPLASLLDDFRVAYAKMSHGTKIHGLIVADQDAKVLAANTFFDRKINYWDVGAIGAALYGVAKQARDFFQTDDLDQATLKFDKIQLYAKNIGRVDLDAHTQRELVLIVIAESPLNIGLMYLLLQRYAPKIRQQILSDEEARQEMQMSEAEFTVHLEELKKQLFSLTEGGL